MYLHTANGEVEYIPREKRTTPPGSLWPASPWDIAPPTNGQFGGGIGGSSERRARGIGAFYACLSVLYDGVSTLPLRQFQGSGPNRQEIDLSPVVYDPWPEITDMDFRGMATWGLAARGNFFGRIVARDKQKYPMLIQPLDNDSVSVDRNRDTGRLEYRLQGKTEPIKADDIIHVRNIARPGAIMGLNPVEELRNTWALAAGADSYAAAFFTNGALPNGIITVGEDLSEEQALAMRDQWLQMHQGIGNAHMPAILTGGAEWHQISVNLDDLKYIESRQMSRSEICSVFRIPPHMIGDVEKSTSFGRGIEQQETTFVRNTLGGYIRRIEIATSRCLPPGQYVEFDLRRRLRGDSVQRAAVVVALVNAGVINRNEARILYEDLQPGGPELDAFLQPMNMGEAGVFAPPVLPAGSASAPKAGSEVRSLEQLTTIVDDMHRLLALRDIDTPALLPGD